MKNVVCGEFADPDRKEMIMEGKQNNLLLFAEEGIFVVEKDFENFGWWWCGTVYALGGPFTNSPRFLWKLRMGRVQIACSRKAGRSFNPWNFGWIFPFLPNNSNPVPSWAFLKQCGAMWGLGLQLRRYLDASNRQLWAGRGLTHMVGHPWELASDSTHQSKVCSSAEEAVVVFGPAPQWLLSNHFCWGMLLTTIQLF